MCLHSKMEEERLNSTFLRYFHLSCIKCFATVSTAVRWLNIVIFFQQKSKIKGKIFNLNKGKGVTHPDPVPRGS